jgi:hypothetical protein
LAIVIASLFGISLISNHPVAGSIIVTHQSTRFFLPHLLIVYGPTKSTHNTSQGSASASFGGNNPYFLLDHFVFWHIWHFVHTSCTSFLSFGHHRYCLRVCSVLVSPGWHSVSWYHSTTRFCNAVGITILSL